jgi:hypothetical protein
MFAQVLGVDWLLSMCLDKCPRARASKGESETQRERGRGGVATRSSDLVRRLTCPARSSLAIVL